MCHGRDSRSVITARSSGLRTTSRAQSAEPKDAFEVANTFTRFPLDVTIRSGNPSTEGRSCTSGRNPRSERPTSVPSWAEALLKES
jgi:hypothetical protein